ncbi:hypothetical protein M513_12575 [Trichuris suis]|uniref:Integrase zinc-binding domain-containing protein n=1 Tax=Trichuris suis TaxID=68888 RepID=A0A085LNL1_9BILA|nr:hypothetical protein M513_12575 [Trichuris suis]
MPGLGNASAYGVPLVPGLGRREQACLPHWQISVMAEADTPTPIFPRQHIQVVAVNMDIVVEYAVRLLQPAKIRELVKLPTCQVLLEKQEITYWKERYGRALSRFATKCCRCITQCTAKTFGTERFSGLVVLERVGCKEFAGFTKVEGNFLAVLKRVQECFPKELADLKAGGALKRTSVLLSFTPFLYTDELIRTGGSLEGSPLPYQYPVLLPAQHPLSKRIAKELLCRLKHSGTDAVFSAIRQHFWMVQGRQLAKGVRRSCGLCIKQSTRSGQHLMAGLPIERLAIDCALSPHIR